MTLLNSLIRSQKENIFNVTDSVMLDAKCIRMRDFATEISKIFWGIAPGPACWVGRRSPSPNPTTSALRRFAPPAPSTSQSSIPEWRNQKLNTLGNLVGLFSK